EPSGRHIELAEGVVAPGQESPVFAYAYTVTKACSDLLELHALRYIELTERVVAPGFNRLVHVDRQRVGVAGGDPLELLSGDVEVPLAIGCPVGKNSSGGRAPAEERAIVAKGDVV